MVGGFEGKGKWRDEGQRGGGGTRTCTSVVDMFAQDQTAKAIGQRAVVNPDDDAVDTVWDWCRSEEQRLGGANGYFFAPQQWAVRLSDSPAGAGSGLVGD